jgi:hypothetical protein
MRISLIILTLTSALLWNTAYCEEYIYTWKDESGVLNITDYAPPPGVEILEISPSHRKEAEEYWRQRQMLKEKADKFEQQRRTEKKAAEARKNEIDAFLEADQNFQQAEQMMEDVTGSRKKKRRYFRRAKRLAEKGEKKIQEADAVREEAERLEEKLSNP